MAKAAAPPALSAEEAAARESWAARELRFVPTPASAPPPVLLTQRERELYDESGFVLAAAPVLSPAEVRFHGDLWEALYAAEGEPGNGFSINVSRELPLWCSVSSDAAGCAEPALPTRSAPALPANLTCLRL